MKLVMVPAILNICFAWHAVILWKCEMYYIFQIDCGSDSVFHMNTKQSEFIFSIFSRF